MCGRSVEGKMRQSVSVFCFHYIAPRAIVLQYGTDHGDDKVGAGQCGAELRGRKMGHFLKKQHKTWDRPLSPANLTTFKLSRKTKTGQFYRDEQELADVAR